MKKMTLNALALAAFSMTSACMPGGGDFQAGEWEVEGWMESDIHPDRIEPQTHSAKVSEQLAAMDAKTVFFNAFYSAGAAGDVVFANGEISGHLSQSAVAPFPEHTQNVTGSYQSDAFEVRITLPEIAGIQAYQVVKGRLVEPM
ncbi:hypothetical protein [Erythrobacter sp. Alg231-14]|uniref:hypothetical protein n=1 Tax=Erythrobacter sp. Alg231-14 TaxID=1922225 RepID=UPI000D54CD00